VSYWTVANGPGRDAAKVASPDAAILDAMIAAKIPPAAAQRLATALAAVYTPRAELPAALTQALKRSSGPEQGNTAPGAEKEEERDEKAGVPTLALDGRVFISNNLNVGGNLAVNNLRVFQNAAVDRTLSARDGVFRNLAVLNAAEFGPNQAVFNVPLVANRAVNARAGGFFSGQNVFDGNVQLNGAVDWNGVACRPGNVVLTKSLLADGTAKVIVGTGEVRVLNDLGDGQPSTFEWTYEAVSQAVIQAMVTEAITVVTSVGFDAENCAVTTGGQSIFRVVSVTTADVAGLTGVVKINSVP
jgi:hypothetical protein